MSDFKIEKPGKYVRRDGVIETVHAILPPECGMTYAVFGCGKVWALSGAYTGNWPHPFDLIAPWNEPRFRAWRAEEVPLGAWIRNKTGSAYRAMILGVSDDGFIATTSNDRLPEFRSEHAADMLTYREHSLDHGKTWTPCGVKEAQ